MKNTMKLMTIALMSTSVLGAVTAFAGEDGKGDKVTTEGKISFKSDETGVVNPPVDPETDPEGEIITPGDKPGGETGNPGPLQINWAPNLDFDINDVSVKTEFYNAKLTDNMEKPLETREGEENPEDPEKPKYAKVPNFVQVTDKRGTGNGWALSLTQKGEFNSEKGKLEGARIHFKNVNMSSNMPKETFPTSDLVGEEKDTVLVPDKKTTLMDADEKKGMGRYSLYFGKVGDGSAEKSVQLEVPGNIAKYADVAYTTSLEWTLEGKPFNEDK